MSGVVAASDDPPEVTMEPHLEMSYNREMPGDTENKVVFATIFTALTITLIKVKSCSTATPRRHVRGVRHPSAT